MACAYIGSDSQRVLLGLIRMYFQLQRLTVYQVFYQKVQYIRLLGLNIGQVKYFVLFLMKNGLCLYQHQVIWYRI